MKKNAKKTENESHCKSQGFHIKHWGKVLLFIETAALAVIFLAMFLNPWVVGRILGKVGSFSATTNVFIYKVEIIMLIVGLSLLALQRLYLKDGGDKTKEITVNVLIFLVSFAVILMILEAGVRILAPQQTLSNLKSSSPQIFEEKDYASWGFKPNATGRMVNGEINTSHRINSFGMRDNEKNIEKAEGVKRILIMGDSLTEGYSVEQEYSYPAQLEKIMNEEKNSSHKIEVWNAGVDGYSADTEYAYLKNIISNVKPDLVIVGFYSGNDVLDLSRNSWKTDETGLPTYIKSDMVRVEDGRLKILQNDKNPYMATFNKYVNMIFFRWSHLYIFLKKIALGVGDGSYEGITLLMEPYDEETTRNFQMTERLLHEMKSLSEANNASFMILIIPSRLQANDKNWKFAEKKFSKYDLKRDMVQSKLLDWCRSENITCLDLLPYLQGYNETIYNEMMDCHFNARGYLKTAQILSDNIVI